MKKNLIKVLSVLGLALCFNSAVFAADAVVTYVNGKVEVNRNNTWIGLKAGDVVYESETISTGFQSDAKIKYNGSLLSLSALTRVTLEELSSTKSGDAVNVYLNTGAVRSKVTHTGNERVSYTVRSPVAVASVRGTDFIMHANGRVKTLEGAVAVYPARFYVPRVQEIEEAVEEVIEEAVAEESVTEETSESVAEVETKEEVKAVEADNTEKIAVDNNSAVEDTKSETSSESSSDYVPAVATTKATNISSDAPAGAVVVGKNQATEISSTGTFKAPSTVANSEMTKAKAAVTTAAEKEAVSSAASTVTAAATSGTSTTATSSSSPAAKKTGAVTVTVSFE